MGYKLLRKIKNISTVQYTVKKTNQMEITMETIKEIPMVITKTWHIEHVTYNPEVGELKNYVVFAQWKLICTNGVHTSSMRGTVSFNVEPNKTDFTLYEDITEAEMVSWVKSSLGEDTVSTYESYVETQVTGQPNYPTMPTSLPWITQ